MISPCTRHDVVISSLLIQVRVLKVGVSHTQEVVKHTRGTQHHSHRLWGCLHGGEEHLPPLGQDAKCVLGDTPGSRQTVIEDAFFLGETSVTVRFHEMFFEGKRIISNYVEGHRLVISRQWSWSRQAQGSILNMLQQFTVVIDLGI